MRLSVLLSIYNRSDLLRYGLASLTRQTMPAEDFEILIIDDGSTEDLSEVYRELEGKLNIRHIRLDSTRHPIVAKVIAGHGSQFHTPALSTNVGIKQARGEALLITQPEIIHHPESLEIGSAACLGTIALRRYELGWWPMTGTNGDSVQGQFFAFGDVALTRMGTPKDSKPCFNDWYMKPDTEPGFDDAWTRALHDAQRFPADINEWWIGFVPREAALAVDGVEEEYLRGAYGEDSSFRLRVEWSGLPSIRIAPCKGIHLNHEHEATLYRRQERDGDFWRQGATINRKRFHSWKATEEAKPVEDRETHANLGREWGSDDVVVSETEMSL